MLDEFVRDLNLEPLDMLPGLLLEVGSSDVSCVAGVAVLSGCCIRETRFFGERWLGSFSKFNIILIITCILRDKGIPLVQLRLY